jgi:TRAP-type C4-dicarboxylate transport system substrate-binding protein
MRRIVLMVTILTVVAALFTVFVKPAPATAAAQAATPAIPTLKLRVSGPWSGPESFPPAEGTELYLKRITERSGGKITFEYYWNAVLTGRTDTPDALQKGTVDLALTNPLYTESKFPLGSFEYSFPVTCEDPGQVMKAKNRIMKEIPAFQEMYAKWGIRTLFALPSENYGWNSVDVIEKFEDFKGKKFTSAGRWTEMWQNESGLVQVSGTSGTTFELHQSRVVTGNTTPISLNYAQKLYTIAKNFLHGYGVYTYPQLLINLNTWNKLGPEAQKIFLDEAKAIDDWFPPLLAQRENEMREKMKATGVIFRTMSPAMRQKWNEVSPDVPAIWAAEVAGKGYPGWEIAGRYQDILKELGFQGLRRWAVKK